MTALSGFLSFHKVNDMVLIVEGKNCAVIFIAGETLRENF